MNKTLFSFIFFLALALIAAPGPAAAQIKDSYYYMGDDGKQSPQEMEEEAMYVYDTCTSNAYQKTYFDCQCLAGAFMQMREKLGGIAPQEEILQRLTRSDKAKCANTVVIAGQAYQECQAYAKISREYQKDNEEYCTCVGNEVARKFDGSPFLRTQYISDLHTDAMVACTSRNDKGNPLPRD